MSTLAVCAGSALVLPPPTVDNLFGPALLAGPSLNRGADHAFSVIVPAGGVMAIGDSTALRHGDLVAPVRAGRQATSSGEGGTIAHIEPVLCASQPQDRHSMRAPPVEDDDSSDGDGDGDDDDDDADVLRMTRTDDAAPADSSQLSTIDTDDGRPTDTLPTLDTSLPVSFVFDVQSLRAPPQ